MVPQNKKCAYNFWDYNFCFSCFNHSFHTATGFHFLRNVDSKNFDELTNLGPVQAAAKLLGKEWILWPGNWMKVTCFYTANDGRNPAPVDR